MKIKDVMSRDVETCSPDTTLAEAGWKMWDNDCGALPIVDNGKVVGVITDRDITIAAATRPRSAREISVREVMNGSVHACNAEESVQAALDIMSREQIRRLPVVDSEDRLQGMLSMNDLIIRSESPLGRTASELSSQIVMQVLKRISEHRQKPEERTVEKESSSVDTASAQKTAAARR